MPPRTPPPVPPDAIVLAAGASSRMGVPKALLRIGDRTALEHLVAVLLEGGVRRVVVVLGAHSCRVRSGVSLPDVTLVRHDGWSAGRTSSLQAGLRALPRGGSACLLAPVDMPLVRPETVRALVAAATRPASAGTVLAPRHADRHGHPVLLPCSAYPAIERLGPDEPLRDLLRELPRDAVPVDDPGVLLDLDTPADVAQAPGVSLPDGRV